MASRIITKGSKAAEIFLTRPQCSQPLISSIARTFATDNVLLRRPQSHHPNIVGTEASVARQSQDNFALSPLSSSSSRVHFSRVAYDTAVADVSQPGTENENGESIIAENRWTLLKEETFELETTDNIILFADNAMIISKTKDIQEIEIFYRCNGLHSSLPSIPSSIRGAARLPDGRLVLCGRKELVFYDVNLDFVSSSKLSSGCPNTMAVDKKGTIILGMMNTKTIAIYNPDGTFQRLFHTDSSPLSLAVTSEGQLVTSFVDGTLQIVEYNQTDSSHDAINSRSISSPPSIHQWQPTSVCCSDNGDIFVVDWNQGSVYRYTSNGEFLECVGKGLRDPQDIAVSSNGDELNVLESGLSALSIARPSKGPCVKTFGLDK